MNCNDCQNLMPEFALSLLDEPAQQRVAAHLATGCEECRQQLLEVTEAWSALPEALPHAAPPAEIRQRLLERIREDCKRQAFQFTAVAEPDLVEPRARSVEPRAKSSTAWLFVAASLVGLLAGYWWGATNSRDTMLAARYQSELSESRRTFGANEIFLASLDASMVQRQWLGHLIWDGMAEQLHVYATGLPEPAEDETYRLWFVTENDEWTAVGALAEHTPGMFAAVLDLPTLRSDWTRAVVTLEPSGTGEPPAAQPTGPVHMQGGIKEPVTSWTFRRPALCWLWFRPPSATRGW